MSGWERRRSFRIWRTKGISSSCRAPPAISRVMNRMMTGGCGRKILVTAAKYPAMNPRTSLHPWLLRYDLRRDMLLIELSDARRSLGFETLLRCKP